MTAPYLAIVMFTCPHGSHAHFNLLIMVRTMPMPVGECNFITLLFIFLVPSFDSFKKQKEGERQEFFKCKRKKEEITVSTITIMITRGLPPLIWLFYPELSATQVWS
mgnify:CR=1 FL=1